MGVRPIKVAVRFYPYARRPGTSFLVPGTEIVETVYPSFIDRRTLCGKPLESCSIPPNKKGAFLHQKNWERGGGPARLSLGIHKKQEVESIRLRLDLKEILPLWFRLGQYYRDTKIPETADNTLLGRLLKEDDKEKVLGRFQELYLAGFSDGFVPRLEDVDRWGFSIPPIKENPLSIISQGTEKIASLFIQERGDEIFILPSLPSAFPSGRLINYQVGQALVSIEWTKGFLRQVHLVSTEEKRPKLIFPKEVASFRYRKETDLFVWDNFIQ